MFKEKAHHVLLFCFIVTLTSAVLQYLNPSYSFFDGGFIIAIMLTIFLHKDGYTSLFGTIGAILVVIASFYQIEGIDRYHLILQHSFSLVIIILATVFVLYVKKLYRSIESEQQ